MRWQVKPLQSAIQLRKMKAFWDARYAQQTYSYGKEPNVYFKNTLKTLAPGKILLAAEGEGRNAVYAASIGWEVYAYDFSEFAYQKALKLAAEKGVSLNYQIGSLSDLEFPHGYFDAIGLVYVHFPNTLSKANHQLLTQLLKPKGRVILEAFSKNQLSFQKQNPKVGGPKNLNQLYDTTQLKAEFKNFTMIELKEEVIELAEGIFHQGQSSVVRMHAQKREY